jgi:Fe-S-cluster containining protein
MGIPGEKKRAGPGRGLAQGGVLFGDRVNLQANPRGCQTLLFMTGPDELAHAVRTAAARAEVVGAVTDLYAELSRRIDVRKPRCDASGRCCRFEEFGHRLYVTTIELAAFLGTKTEVRSQKSEGLPVVGQGGACPFQEGGLCSVHAIRPFGCRMFFCDETSTEWQHAQYEELHAELKRLHERLGVPYHYIEWREALRRLGLSRP